MNFYEVSSFQNGVLYLGFQLPSLTWFCWSNLWKIWVMIRLFSLGNISFDSTLIFLRQTWTSDYLTRFPILKQRQFCVRLDTEKHYGSSIVRKGRKYLFLFWRGNIHRGIIPSWLPHWFRTGIWRANVKTMRPSVFHERWLSQSARDRFFCLMRLSVEQSEAKFFSF